MVRPTRYPFWIILIINTGLEKLCSNLGIELHMNLVIDSIKRVSWDISSPK